MNAGSYRVSIRAPGHLEVLSSETLQFTAGQTTTYDFTIPAKVEGLEAVNFVKRSGSVLLAAGDVNQDGSIDFIDMPFVDSDNNSFVCGFRPTTDLNLDGYVDGNDYTDINNNSTNGLIRSY